VTYSPTLSPAAEMRALIGFAVQPLPAATIGFATFPVVEYTGRSLYGGRTADIFDAAVGFGLAAGFVAVPVTVLGALPIFAWLVSRGPVTRTHALAAGAVLGNVPGAVIVAGIAASRLNAGLAVRLEHLTFGAAGAIRAVLLGAFVGSACAAVFWWIAGPYLAHGPAARS
jgi:hypothetical protein